MTVAEWIEHNLEGSMELSIRPSMGFLKLTIRKWLSEKGTELVSAQYVDVMKTAFRGDFETLLVTKLDIVLRQIEQKEKGDKNG